MDNCMTCQDRPCCPMYDEYGTIEGCFNWKPIDVWGENNSEDLPILAIKEPRDELSAASAFMLGFAVSLPIWIFIIWVIKAVFFDG